ncbi:hypothetical protein EBN03_13275 [Nocardia stercoris]|uniref:Esterase n=1 Tax=Nocardia stercoris TaxID=2483361 RepID=A0A3M2L6B3_9NOCA|nr:hypothetical protein EBN03_13275 [Nocardia stercoris]
MELRVDGLRRTCSLRLPTDQRPEMPLMLVLHGSRSPVLAPIQRFAEASSRRRSGFEAFADRHGVAVAYPDAVTGRWADGRGVTVSEEKGIDDVAFLRAVAEECAGRFGTRRDGILVAGISNGAFMAHRTALEASDLVVAFLAIAGGLPAALAGAQPTHAVSALLIHGTADPVVPIEGGYSRRRGPDGELRGRTLSLADSARHWADIDRCGDEAVVTEYPSGPGPDDLARNRRTVAGGVGGTRVEAWAVEGMGHTWPGQRVPAVLRSALGASAANIDAAEEFCRFALPLLASAADRRR